MLDKTHEMMTLGEVAELLRVTRQTAMVWARNGKLPKPIQLGRRLLWRTRDVRKLLERASR